MDVLDFIQDINERCLTYECIGFLDDDPSEKGSVFEDLPVLGTLSDASRFREVRFVNALGSPSNYLKRPRITDRLGVPPGRFETLVHPDARVSRSAIIGRGVIIYPYTFVGARARIGDYVTILSNSAVNHDVSLGEFTIVASGVSLSGGVTVGECCYLGTGCSILENTRVGDNCLIGMASVVRKDVEAGTVAVGNPASTLRQATMSDESCPPTRVKNSCTETKSADLASP